MKRKFLALILAALCATGSSVCFTACNANDDGKGSDNTENNQPEITKLQEYDLSGISFNDKSVTYDGNFHSIEIVGDLPQGVSVSYTGGGTNAGEYTVTAKFAGDTVTHKPIADITAKLTIIKAPFMGEISFSGAQFDYDGEAHNITLTGDLPEGIFVSYEYKNEAGETVTPENVKEIGEYTVTAVFTSENYQLISSLTAVLKIVGESLYDAQGNINRVTMAQVLKEYLNDERIKQVLNVDVGDEGVKFWTYLVHDGKPYIQKYKINQKVWNAVKASESKDELVAALKDINATKSIGVDGSIEAEYTTFDYTEEQNAQFVAMTNNIFAKLEIDGLDVKNVKFAFKTTKGPTISSASNGWLYATSWDQYYLIEVNGQMELLKIGLSASTEFGVADAAEHVAANSIGTNGKPLWEISSVNRTPLQEENKELYNSNNATATLDNIYRNL